MAIVKKISELTPKGSALANTDLLIVGVDNGTDYDLKSVTGAQVLGNVVSQTITDGVTTKSPSENVVFDALALKVDKATGERLITSTEATILSNTSGVNSGDQDLSSLVVKNTTITGATKTKITYDSKGLITSGTDATTSDIADSTNKRYVTDANLSSIGRIDTALNISGTAIGFGLPTDYGTSSAPLTNAIFTDILGLAVRGVKQKIYHNSATEPTFPANWVKISGEYIPSTLNIIEAYYSGTSTRVEYFYQNDVSLKLLKSNNLSDLTNTTTARSNLGLGSLATQSGTFSGTSSGTNTGDQDLSAYQPYTTATTGSVISFVVPQVYNSVASPSSSNITDNLTGAKIGIVQKIYHNHTVAPTFPAGWVKMGTATYTTSTLNVIFAEWVSSTRVEYWITKPS